MNRSFRHTVLLWYCAIFYGLFFFKLSNGMLLSQVQPVFIYDTFDAFTWLFMQTGIPQWLLQSRQFLLFDALYYTAPLALLLAAYTKPPAMIIAAVYLLLVNWIYLQCYSLFPISSITIYIAGFLFPVLFLANTETTFLLLFAGLRYFFLYFFCSAGVWKIVQGGVFNPLQLSAILLEQHKELLTSSPRYWLSQWYQWLIEHHLVSYALYLLVDVMELSFIVGFFTRRFDRLLLSFYLLFLFANHLIMRIPYYETMPFLLLLYLQPIAIPRQESSFFQKA